jgi:hypothetical protein
MVEISKLDDLYCNIEDYFDDELVDDDMSYLDSDNDFEDYLDFRVTRKPVRKGRVRRGSHGETPHRKLSDDWEELQCG